MRLIIPKTYLMASIKSSGVFIEVNDYSILTAVTSGLDAPLTIESLNEYPVDFDPDKLKDALTDRLNSNPRGYIPARCAMYPKSRFLRRVSLESIIKAKDPNYFSDLLSSQFRIDPAIHASSVVSIIDGSEFDIGKGIQNQKELILCGVENEELQTTQDRLVEYGLYPDRLELGSLTCLGGLMDYSQWKGLDLPTMILEVTPENSNVFILSKEKVDVCRPIAYGLNSMFAIIQQELGLKDEESAQKMFYSDTFDFTEVGPKLLNKLQKEMQSSTGFYEVQTGQTIGQIFVNLLPKNLNWIGETLSENLGVELLQFDFSGWLEALNLSTSESVDLQNLEGRWLGIFSLMADFESTSHGKE